jgi:phage-related protein
VAFETWTPPVKPQLGTGLELDERILEAPFGDGAKQIVSDGINAQFEVHRLIWNGCPNAAADEIEAFWRSKGRSITFWFTVPGRASAKKFRFNSALSRRQIAGEADAIEVGIEESFEIES